MSDSAPAPAAREARTSARSVLRHPWEQQPGENDLWYSRFLRFVALGPGRSVSLVATGRRNAYPVPAHWPIQAKQRLWRERAAAFDRTAHNDPSEIDTFNQLLSSFGATMLGKGDEGSAIASVVQTGGYHAPPEDEDYEDDTANAGH